MTTQIWPASDKDGAAGATSEMRQILFYDTRGGRTYASFQSPADKDESGRPAGTWAAGCSGRDAFATEIKISIAYQDDCGAVKLTFVMRAASLSAMTCKLRRPPEGLNSARSG